MAFEAITADNCDFHGWATKCGVRCTDGRTIMHNAFADNDGAVVPMVWNHKHDSPYNVLGKAKLENRGEGVYAYCTFNDTEQGQNAKLLVQHGDVNALSIYANGLKQDGAKNVRHGVIREVSLVLAGANPKALIQTVLAHGDGYDFDDDEMIMSLSAQGCQMSIAHADQKEAEDGTDPNTAADTASKQKIGETDTPENKKEGESNMAEKKETTEKTDGEKTVKEVFDSLTEEQQNVVYFMIGEALKLRQQEEDDEDDAGKGGNKNMKHNVFDQGQTSKDTYLSHSDMEKIFSDAKRCGSLRKAVEANLDGGILAHSIDTEGMDTGSGDQNYGFNDASMLFPEFRNPNGTPEWISRNTNWVLKVLGSVHRTPFSRIKSVFANITEDEARAKGYLKGKQKKTEVFTTLKRTTAPQTVYKTQKLDRDDIDDIIDFDVVAWIRAEMRVMLNEELARAILIGDGRDPSAEDKISEANIRPIATDVPLFNTQVGVTVKADADEETTAKAVINAAIRGRKNYKGSGSPTLYTSEDWLTEMLLLEDGIGHKLYKTEEELATSLRVKNIVTVEPMSGHKISVDGQDKPLIGVIVNLADYNVGADKGGAVSMFDDFDIDYNQNKYLIETRCSGALIKPFSAITLYLDKADA